MIWFSERTGKLLTFEEWMDTNSDELNCLFAENGADREMDFDYERDCEIVYDRLWNTIKYRK